MCIKAGRDELESVRNLMGMSLHAVVAESLGVELDEITPESRLVEDLGMDSAKAAGLTDLIADTFDGLVVNPFEFVTYAELLDKVVTSEFEEALASA